MAAAFQRDAIWFGPFTLIAGERLLTKEGVIVELGARTLDLLIALVSRPNQVLSKKELMEQVWPDVTVDEGSLRFHVAKLRKALGDGANGQRYIITSAGRGYCFVAPVARRSEPDNRDPAEAVNLPHANLPSPLVEIIGRDDDVHAISAQLMATRFVTIAGVGGVGKTSVATAVGHHLIESFEGAVVFVDLGAIDNSELLASSLASTFGLAVQSYDPTAGLIAYLSDRRMLLIFDTCEHLIDAAAALTRRLFAAAPQVHILATSREPIRVEGEHIYKLETLPCPPDDIDLTASALCRFPASQLFVERMAAGGARLDLSDADAAIIASICRKLDGMALAIELAAGRVQAYGLQQTAALLDQHLALPWHGQRSAPPRQRTLQATLDWSYRLLSEPERVVLRRLAVFVGHFTLEAALAVVADATVDQTLVLAAIDGLVAKSMLATRPAGAMMRYQLLGTTRAYALEISVDQTERRELAARHTGYYQRWLEQTGTGWSLAERAMHLAELGNVRAALEWCFGATGDTRMGVELASAAAPVFLTMSLLTEGHRWSERAILALDDQSRGGREEMHLQAALGVSTMFIRGNNEEARNALNRGIMIAEQRGDTSTQLQLLSRLHLFHLRVGDFKTARDYSIRNSTISATTGDTAALALARSSLGIVLHLIGELRAAREQLSAALQNGEKLHRASTLDIGSDHHTVAALALARTLWLEGYPVQSEQRVRQTVHEAAAIDHPVTVAIALNWAISFFLWIGDLRSAEEHICWLISHVDTHSFESYPAVGRGFKGQLSINRGDAQTGVEYLQDALTELHAKRYELFTTPFNISLAQGLGTVGRIVEGITVVDEAIRMIEMNGDFSYMPEALRVKSSLLLSMPQPMRDGAEISLRRSLQLSRQQGALAWELRTSIDLARLLVAEGRTERARLIVQPVFEQFTEGFDSVDLQTARHLLAALV